MRINNILFVEKIDFFSHREKLKKKRKISVRKIHLDGLWFSKTELGYGHHLFFTDLSIN